MAMTREMKNEIRITGVVVKSDIKEFQTKKGEDAIGGSLVIRTTDGSENEISIYSSKWKKDKDGNETGETTYFFNQYDKLKDDLITLETDSENASVVSVTQGTFGANDFKGKDGNVVSTVRENGKFITILTDKEISVASQEAKFEIEGIIEKIEDELDKEQIPTGKGKLKLNHILTTRDFKNPQSKPEPKDMFPITLTVPEHLWDAFKGAGYFEGCLAKFVGNLKNTVQTDTIIEKQSFGEDIVKEITKHVKEFEVRSGNTANTYDSIGLTQEDISMLQAKRKQHLEEVKNGELQQDGTFGGGTNVSKPSTPTNPFASASVNPFA